MALLDLRRTTDRLREALTGPLVVALVLFVVIFAAYVALLPYVDRALAVIASKAGGTANLVIFLIAPIFLGAWVLALLSGRLLPALVTFVLLLPIIGRAPRLVGLDAFVGNVLGSGEAFVQRISVTTGCLLVMAVFALLIALRRPASPASPTRAGMDAFMLALVLYASFATVSQFVYHEPGSAALLSLGAGWQYVAFAFVVRAAIRDRGDLRWLMLAIVAAVVLNMALRMVTIGGLFATTESGDFRRSGGFAFGPAVSYAGYVAMALVMALSLQRGGPTSGARFMWGVVVVLLAVEELLMSTRGALLGLFALGLLWRWRGERGRVLAVGMVGIAALTVVLNFTPIFGTRSITLSPAMLQDPNVASRLQIFVAHTRHLLDGFGLGRGIGRVAYEYAPANGLSLPPHNLVQLLAQEVGLIATVFFTAAVGIAVVRLWRVLPRPTERTDDAVFLLVAIVVWLIHANTSGTSIAYYYPYEATLLVFALLAAASTAPVWAPTRDPRLSAASGRPVARPASAAGASA